MADSNFIDKFFDKSVSKHILITSDDGTVNLNNSDLHIGTFELSESICSGNELQFGLIEAGSIKFKTSNLIIALKNKWLNISFYFDDDKESIYKCGRYKVYSDLPTADRRYREILAYDMLYDIIKLDILLWYNNLFVESTEITLKEFRDSFFEYVGLEQEEITLANDDMTVTKTVELEELSGKTVLSLICEINGCLGYINRQGKFQYIYLQKEIQGLYPSQMLFPADNLYPKNTDYPTGNKLVYKKCTYETYTVKGIKQVQIRQQENEIGAISPLDTQSEALNTYIVEDNFLVYGKTSSELQQIADNLLEAVKGIVYRPFNADCVGNPCIELGDPVRIASRYDIIESYVLKRTIKGIQAMSDSYEAKGEEYRSNKINSVSKQIVELKGKTNTLTRTVEETNNTIANVEKGLKTEISVTADSIKQTVANNSTVWYEGDLKIDYRGFGLPETIYEPNGDNLGKIYLDKNTGYLYECILSENDYIWEKSGQLEKADSTYKTMVEQTDKEIRETLEKEYQPKSNMVNYPTTEQMSTEIVKSANGIEETISKSQKTWDISNYDENILIYGYGEPTSERYPTDEYSEKKYLDQTTGKLYKVQYGIWTFETQLILISDELETQIKETAEGINMEVSKSRTVYDTDGKVFDLYKWGHPDNNYNAVDYPLKTYLDQSTGQYYKSTLLSANVYIWVYEGTLDTIYEDFSTGYYQTEKSIALKVDVGNVSNEISVEEVGVNISSNRLSVDSDNFKLYGTGEIEATGTVKSGSDDAYIKLSKEEAVFYRDNSVTGKIYGYPLSTGYSGLLLSTPKDFISMGITDGTATTFKYILNNGFGSYQERHIFNDDARFGSVVSPEFVLDNTVDNEIKIDTTTVAGTDYIRTNKSLYVIGDIQAGGTKYRVVDTKNYQKVGMNAFETAEAYFSDIGSGIISDNVCYVWLDPKFIETIDETQEYQVFLTRTSKETTDYVEKHKGYFIVHGENGATFDWMITAKQKGYQLDRMETVYVEEDNSIPYDMSIFMSDNAPANISLNYAIELEYDYEKQAIADVENTMFQENLELEV